MDALTFCLTIAQNGQGFAPMDISGGTAERTRSAAPEPLRKIGILRRSGSPAEHTIVGQYKENRAPPVRTGGALLFTGVRTHCSTNVRFCQAPEGRYKKMARIKVVVKDAGRLLLDYSTDPAQIQGGKRK